MAASSEDECNWVVIPTDTQPSDGDSSYWPTEAKWAMPDDSGWRIAMAEMWLRKIGAYEEGISYIIKRLPKDYALFDRARTTNPIRDNFLFGHPSGKYFQSRVTFFPHFYWLMTGRSGECECKPCEYQREGKMLKKRKRDTLAGPEFGSARGISDEAGADIFKRSIMKMKTHGRYDKPIDEPQNMDWRLTHNALDHLFTRLTLQAAFIPRRGETVLWTPSLEGRLEWNPNTKSIQMHNEKGDWLGVPGWRAGIVTQVPRKEVLIQEIIETSEKKSDVTSSGFRIETLPDPLSDDKSFSLHYKYVPLKCIKPFNAWAVFLQSIPRDELHPSIEHALTTMASWSLVARYRFRGEWPTASIYCKGIYIGAEMLALKDTVRLKPNNHQSRDYLAGKHYVDTVTDVLVIDAIRLQLDNCIDDPKSDEYAESYNVKIEGQVYRLNKIRPKNDPYMAYPLRRMADNEVLKAFQQVGMMGYGQWYRFKGMKQVTVSPDMILGRCYEPEANILLWGDRRLGHDLPGILSEREFSRLVDARIPEGGRWFWGDYRAETLGLATVNGVDVGPAAEQRDAKKWRAIFRIIDGPAGPVDHRDAGIPSDGAGRPAKIESAFSGVSQTSRLVSTGLGEISDASSDEEESEREDNEDEEGDATNKEENDDSGAEEDVDENDRGEEYQLVESEAKSELKEEAAEHVGKEDKDDEHWSFYSPGIRKLLRELDQLQKLQLAEPELKPLTYCLGGQKRKESAARARQTMVERGKNRMTNSQPVR